MKKLTVAALATQLCAPGSVVTAAVLLALGAAPAVGATYTGSSSAGSGTIHTPGPSDSDSFSGPAPGSTSSASSALAGAIDPSAVYMYGSSNSTGSASTGAAHATATATAQANNPAIVGGGSANAQASASAAGAFSDVFELNAAGYAPGTMVSMMFAIDAHGGFGGNGSTTGGGILSAASWSGTSWWRATTRLDGYGFEEWQQLSSNSSGAVYTTGNGSLDTAIYTVNLALGAHSVFLGVEASATANASAFTHSADGASTFAEAAFTADLGHTLGWGGILGLSLLDGTVITDFTAMSTTSGFNYANAYSAVPVPAAVWLFGSGLLGLVGVMRRKRTPA
ncbi:MAG TPA: VPLPA-CTERM sorting domain-containing protein [Gammaproteobacteria bacterium]